MEWIKFSLKTCPTRTPMIFLEKNRREDKECWYQGELCEDSEYGHVIYSGENMFSIKAVTHFMIIDTNTD